MNIIHGNWLSKEAIESSEKNHDAKFICYTPLKTRSGSYFNQHCAIFYAKESHPNGSNWFALFYDYMDRMVIANANEVEGRIIDAVKRGDNAIYSAFRHDFTCLGEDDDRICIDGGMDYTKIIGNLDKAEMISLKVTKDGLVEV